MELNIYKGKKVEKTYTADTYDLMWGTVEDVANAVDLDKLKSGSDVEIITMVAKLVVSNMAMIHTLLKDIFEGLTDDEIKRTKVSEIAGVIIDVVKYTISELSFGSSKN